MSKAVEVVAAAIRSMTARPLDVAEAAIAAHLAHLEAEGMVVVPRERVKKPQPMGHQTKGFAGMDPERRKRLSQQGVKARIDSIKQE